MKSTFGTYLIGYDDQQRKYTLEVLLSLWSQSFSRRLSLKSKKFTFLQHGEGPTEHLFGQKARALKGHSLTGKGGLCMVNDVVRDRFHSLTSFMPQVLLFSTFVKLVLFDLLNTDDHPEFLAHCASKSEHYKTYIKKVFKSKASAGDKAKGSKGSWLIQGHAKYIQEGVKSTLILKDPDADHTPLVKHVVWMMENKFIDKIQLTTGKHFDEKLSHRIIQIL